MGYGIILTSYKNSDKIAGLMVVRYGFAVIFGSPCEELNPYRLIAMTFTT